MLAKLLEDTPVLLADGATGTNLFERGLVSGDSPELWNDIHADRIRQLHRAFVEAGADIILTNSFGANRRRLMLHQLEGRTRELNRLAARLYAHDIEAGKRQWRKFGSTFRRRICRRLRRLLRRRFRGWRIGLDASGLV